MMTLSDNRHIQLSLVPRSPMFFNVRAKFFAHMLKNMGRPGNEANSASYTTIRLIFMVIYNISLFN